MLWLDALIVLIIVYPLRTSAIHCQLPSGSGLANVTWNSTTSTNQTLRLDTVCGATNLTNSFGNATLTDNVCSITFSYVTTAYNSTANSLSVNLTNVNASFGNSAFCTLWWQLGANATLDGSLYLSPPLYLLRLSTSSAPDPESLSIALTPDASDADVVASTATPVSTTALATGDAVTTDGVPATTTSSAATTGAPTTSAAPDSAAGAGAEAATQAPPPPPQPPSPPPIKGSTRSGVWAVFSTLLICLSVLGLAVLVVVGGIWCWRRRLIFRLFRFRRLRGGGAHYVFDDDRADLYSL
jgi:hypothetical protein